MIKQFVIGTLAALTITSTALANTVYLPTVSTGQQPAAAAVSPLATPAPALISGEETAATLNYWLGCLLDGSDMNDSLTEVPAEHEEYIIRICQRYASHHEGTDDYHLDIAYNGRYWPAMTAHDYRHWLDVNAEWLDGNVIVWSDTPADIVSNTMLLWHLVDYVNQ